MRSGHSALVHRSKDAVRNHYPELSLPVQPIRFHNKDTVNAPWISPELAVQRMGNLEQIHGIEAGVQALVTFIICAAVKHFIIDDNIIITKKNFTNQCEIRL